MEGNIWKTYVQKYGVGIWTDFTWLRMWTCGLWTQ